MCHRQTVGDSLVEHPWFYWYQINISCRNNILLSLAHKEEQDLITLSQTHMRRKKTFKGAIYENWEVGRTDNPWSIPQSSTKAHSHRHILKEVQIDRIRWKHSFAEQAWSSTPLSSMKTFICDKDPIKDLSPMDKSPFSCQDNSSKDSPKSSHQTLTRILQMQPIRLIGQNPLILSPSAYLDTSN